MLHSISGRANKQGAVRLRSKTHVCYALIALAISCHWRNGALPSFERRAESRSLSASG